MTKHLETDFRHDNVQRIGILLVNLGTPSAPTTSAVREYLAEFLWDSRVIDYPRPLWWLILHGVILRVRPGKVAKAYASIWGEHGSPLLTNTQAQGERIAGRLNLEHGNQYAVEIAMRYGQPSIEQALLKLRSQNARRILVVPMYPQYSGSTTATVFDAVAEAAKKFNWIPELRFINQYHDHDGYIAALVASVKEYWNKNGVGEHLLFSFHGLPRRYLDEGDPYHCQCQKTARLVASSLKLSDADWSVAFQSRVGREEWLRPYTDEVLLGFAENGRKNIDIICPGFSADCLETLEEIAIRNQEDFEEAGGEKVNYIPALNARDDHIQALIDLIATNCQGWSADTSSAEVEAAQRVANESHGRAVALGAKS